jgi:putative hydrolase of HD superfamily
MQIKAPNPIQSLKEKPSSAIITIFFELAHLKQLFRQGWLLHNIPTNRCESVADHTLGVAVIAMLLVDTHLPELDALKVYRMALIHDFGEIYAGDITPGAEIDSRVKHTLEKESVTRIFARLPNGQVYLNLWEEFEKGLSPEARFIRQIDKLEMALQASVYEHQGFGDLSDFYYSAGRAISSPELTDILAELQSLR